MNEYSHFGTKVLLLIFNGRNKVLLPLIQWSVSIAIRQLKQKYAYNIDISFS
jgi:hypothetical protein